MFPLCFITSLIVIVIIIIVIIIIIIIIVIFIIIIVVVVVVVIIIIIIIWAFLVAFASLCPRFLDCAKCVFKSHLIVFFLMR